MFIFLTIYKELLLLFKIIKIEKNISILFKIIDIFVKNKNSY